MRVKLGLVCVGTHCCSVNVWGRTHTRARTSTHTNNDTIRVSVFWQLQKRAEQTEAADLCGFTLKFLKISDLFWHIRINQNFRKPNELKHVETVCFGQQSKPKVHGHMTQRLDSWDLAALRHFFFLMKFDLNHESIIKTLDCFYADDKLIDWLIAVWILTVL